MNRFSDAGSTPAVSSPEGRAAKLGLLEVESYGNPTTVEFVRCVGCSSPEGRAARLGFLEVKNYGNPTTVAFYVVVGFLFSKNLSACLQNPPNVLYLP